MKSRMRLTMMLALLLVLGLATDAAAQQVPPPNGPPPRGGRQAQRNPAAPAGPIAMNRVREQWNAYVLTQSRKFLELAPPQVPNFVAKMMALQEIRDQHVRERRRLVMELARMTAPNNDVQPAEELLVTKTRALDDLERQAAQQEQTAVAAIDEVLTPFQRARFRVLEDRMEEQLLNTIEAAKRGAAKAPSSQSDAGNPASAVKPVGRGGGK